MRLWKSLPAVLATFIFSIELNAYAIYGTKWGSSEMGTPGGTVTWSIIDAPITCGGNNETCTSLNDLMPEGYITEIERAFDTWSSVANIDFTQVEDDGVARNEFSTADIRFTAYPFSDHNVGTFAYAYFPPFTPDHFTAPSAGDITFNTDIAWQGIFSAAIFSITLHEIGHAIGLKHNLEPDSVMNTSILRTEPITGLGADDIAGIQAIYGARDISAIPLPAGAWLFISALLSLFGVKQLRANR